MRSWISKFKRAFLLIQVIQEQNCSLSLRCRPMIDILEPSSVQKIEIINDSGKFDHLKLEIFRKLKTNDEIELQIIHVLYPIESMWKRSNI